MNEQVLKLKDSMQKEVMLMREILANMHQEEYSLLMTDRNYWTRILQERYYLIERLSYLRVERIEATKQIHDKEDLEESEILSLRDQMMALMEKMNFQNCRNELLFKQFEHQLEQPFHNHYQPIQSPETEPRKRKASIATYNFKKMNIKSAGLLYGQESHHLDHLAAVCHLMQIPLIVTEEEIADLAHRFYPHLEVICWDYIQVGENLVRSYDIIFYCMPRALFDEALFFAQRFLGKKVHTIWCPHGNSDKGEETYFMEALKQEEVLLVYGEKMIDFLKKKGVLKPHVITGNIRLSYYKKEKPFFDNLVAHLKTSSKTILYAPTWQDYENSSSFFDACPHLIQQLPENWFLIVKLHPNLFLEDEIKVQNLISDYEDKENVVFLMDFPPVYPLLNLTDIYIGDMSSIGYDFLAFNRPMFFLNQNHRSAYLFQCGVQIFPEQYKDIFKIIDIHLPTDEHTFSKIRKETYVYTFGEEKDWDTLRAEIIQVYDTFEDDLSFM